MLVLCPEIPVSFIIFSRMLDYIPSKKCANCFLMVNTVEGKVYFTSLPTMNTIHDMYCIKIYVYIM